MTPNRRHPTKKELQFTLAEQQRLINRLSVNDEFGCFYREALYIHLERMSLKGLAVVFFDIDQMKEANTRWGKPSVNRRIKASINARATDCVTGQTYSGDEFAAFPPEEDAVAMARRIQKGFWDHGLTATFVVATPLPNETALQLLERADNLCKELKDRGQRNSIHVEE